MKGHKLLNWSSHYHHWTLKLTYSASYDIISQSHCICLVQEFNSSPGRGRLWCHVRFRPLPCAVRLKWGNERRWICVEGVSLEGVIEACNDWWSKHEIAISFASCLISVPESHVWLGQVVPSLTSFDSQDRITTKFDRFAFSLLFLSFFSSVFESFPSWHTRLIRRFLPLVKSVISFSRRKATFLFSLDVPTDWRCLS